MKNKNLKIAGYSLLVLIDILGAALAIPFMVVVMGLVGLIFAGFIFAIGISYPIYKIKDIVNQ